MIFNTITAETPVAIIDTIWEPHTFPASYMKPSTIAGKGLRIPHPDSHLHNLVHSVHAHLPWHQSSHGAQPEVCPETNIRETAQAYHIEMALAGVSDEDAVLVQWHALRTLIVTGGLTKAEAQLDQQKEDYGFLRKISISGSSSKQGEVQLDNKNSAALLDEKSDKTGGESGEDSGPLFILQEWRSGPFQRTFTMPADVDVKGCKAKLEHGLLKIDVPKKEPQRKQEESVMLNGT